MTEKSKYPGRWFRVLFIAVTVVIISAVLILILSANTESQPPVRVGIVLSGYRNEPGWNGSNYAGVLSACSSAQCELEVCENVPESEQECVSAVSTLAKNGCNIIFLSSYGYAEYADKLIRMYPRVKFFASGTPENNDNITFYFGRLYEARYLAGIIAGLTTKTHVIGYVAAMPNSEVNRGINAFALGARSVDPDARIAVRFTGSWDDREKELASVDALEALSADVIAYQQNKENVPEACESKGIDFIGCYELTGDYSEHYLTSVDCSWEKIYGEVLRDFLNRRGGFGGYWYGIEDEAVSLTEYSENVSVRARYEVMFAINRINAGRRIFSGEIYDNTGILRCGSGEALSDITLIRGMDWYVRGVEITNESE